MLDTRLEMQCFHAKMQKRRNMKEKDVVNSYKLTTFYY